MIQISKGIFGLLKIQLVQTQGIKSQILTYLRPPRHGHINFFFCVNPGIKLAVLMFDYLVSVSLTKKNIVPENSANFGPGPHSGDDRTEYRGCPQRNDKPAVCTRAWPASTHHEIPSGSVQSDYVLHLFCFFFFF